MKNEVERLKRLNYLSNHYTEYEITNILKLEDIADEINIKFNNNDYETSDLSEVFLFLDEIQNDESLLEKTKSYAEYLRGVILPWHLEDLKEDNYLKVPELNEIIHANCWVNLLDRLEVNEIDLVEFETRLSATIKGKFKEYYDKSKYKWALLYGFHHYWIIKSNRDNKIFYF